MAPRKSKKQTAPADFYVSFGGSHAQRDVDEPSLGQQVEFTVYGTVTGKHETIRDDGETRYSYGVSVEAAWPKGSARPDNAAATRATTTASTTTAAPVSTARTS